MVIYIPIWFSASDGDVPKHMPGVVAARQLEVPDLWYERRRGPTAAELRDQRAYGRATSPRGKFSALCHAKFREPSAVLSTSDNLLPARSLYTFSDNHWEPVNNFLDAGPFRSCQVYWLENLTDSGSEGWVTKAISAYWNPFWNRLECTLMVYYWNETLPAGRQMEWTAYPYIGIENPENISSEMLIFLCKDQWPTNLEQLHYGWLGPTYPQASIDDSYVKALASNALSASLRYRDLELVDSSVSHSRVQPWGLSNINVITGKARAFIEATREIPLMSENTLQNLAAAFTGLAAFALDSDGAGKLFKAITRGDLPRDWYATNARGLTRAQNSARIRALNKEAKLRNMYEEVLPTFDKGNWDSAANAWLTGRYVWSTSVVDLGNGWNYFYDKALQSLGKRSLWYKCHGRAKADNGDLFQCTFSARERALTGVLGFFEHCYRTGTEPNAYVMWDFIPFSFVVDWFIPIGNALNAYTRASHFCPEYWAFLNRYDGNQMCYSVTYEADSTFGPVSVYTRWYEPSPPEVEQAYFLRPDATSNKTLCKRFLDGLALFHP